MRKSRFTPEYSRLLERLRALRIEKGLRQLDVAVRLRVPQQYISRFESGETRMDVIQLWFYCRAVGANFPRLCTEVDRDLLAASGRRSMDAGR